MNYFITGKLASVIDSYSINDIGIPSVVLMERAAVSVTDEIIKLLESKEINYKYDKKVLIVSGVGNNGADGLAVARILSLKGYKVDVVISGNIDKASEEFKTQYRILNNLKINNTFIENKDDINCIFENKYCMIVDALFGIGLSRNIEGLKYELIKSINESDSYVLSIDIPSGLDSNNGAVRKIAIKADMTVTFGYAKAGHWLYNGKNYTGKLIISDIGFCIPDNWNFNNEIEIKDNLFESLSIEDKRLIPKRNKTSNKGSYNNVIIIGAGENMSGAVALSAEASYRTGCGLVKIYAASNNVNVIKGLIKEAVVEEYIKLDFSKINSDKDIIIIGPGLGVNDNAKDLVTKILDVKCRKIIDADALNIIAENKILLNKFDEDTIITPHIKELSRLTDKETSFIKENIINIAKEFSMKYKCITVIKDATTIICGEDGQVRINSSGNSGMSKAGSGDVLTGIIAGMISQKMKLFDAACMGVFIHGMAGELASEDISLYSLMAGDIIRYIPEILV